MLAIIISRSGSNDDDDDDDDKNDDDDDDDNDDNDDDDDDDDDDAVYMVGEDDHHHEIIEEEEEQDLRKVAKLLFHNPTTTITNTGTTGANDVTADTQRIHTFINLELDYDIMDISLLLNGSALDLECEKINVETGMVPYMELASLNKYKLGEIYDMAMKSVPYIQRFPDESYEAIMNTCSISATSICTASSATSATSTSTIRILGKRNRVDSTL